MTPVAVPAFRPEFAALVVHDLKNALGVLEAQLDQLQRDPDRGRAVQAHRQCAEMRQRFVGFLTLYRADGALHAHCDDESPRAFLEGLATLATRCDGAAMLTVGDCHGAPPFWYFDFRLVRLAMEAALHNAWRFARSAVVLDARQEAGYLVLTVTDDGPGIGGAKVDVDAHASGLGTLLCDAVARAHSSAARPGRVRLYDASGGGACFELWLA